MTATFALLACALLVLVAGIRALRRRRGDPVPDLSQLDEYGVDEQAWSDLNRRRADK